MNSEPTSRPAALFPAQLTERARRHGSAPLITYDDRVRAERTELSAVSFVNWVDKTANLLVDELDVGTGARVAMPLLSAHPGHWVSLVWTAACWRVGAVVVPLVDEEAELEVVGPEDAQTSRPGPQRVACSLHPLGFGFSTPLPADVIDFAAEVRLQPDVYLGGEPVTPDGLAWVDELRQVSQRELVRTDREGGSGGARVLVVPTDPWTTVDAALVRPVLDDGSAVVAVGATQEQLAQIVTTERVTARS